jgi:hypothetical protein
VNREREPGPANWGRGRWPAGLVQLLRSAAGGVFASSRWTAQPASVEGQILQRRLPVARRPAATTPGYTINPAGMLIGPCSWAVRHLRRGWHSSCRRGPLRGHPGVPCLQRPVARRSARRAPEGKDPRCSPAASGLTHPGPLNGDERNVQCASDLTQWRRWKPPGQSRSKSTTKRGTYLSSSC